MTERGFRCRIGASNCCAITSTHQVPFRDNKEVAMDPYAHPKEFEASCRQRRGAGLSLLLSAVAVAFALSFLVYKALEPLQVLAALLP